MLRNEHVQHLARAALLAAVLLRAAELEAEPVLTFAPSFVLVEQAGGVAAAGCAPPALADQVVAEFVQRTLLGARLDPELAVLLLTQNPGCGRLFYVPLANDVRGIGYQHADARERFDDTPDSRLEGVAFLNDLPYGFEHPDELSREVKHELGHRWGSRARIEQTGLPPELLLGRDLEHWSYFLDSGGSPLEGNRIQPSGAGQIVVDTPLDIAAFSSLDLYSMGVLPAEQVGPLRVYLPRASDLRDCAGRPLDAASPPQTCGALELAAEKLDLSVDAVIAAEGEREPPAVDTPRSVDVAVLVVVSGARRPNAPECRKYSDEIERQLADFGRATGGRLVLRNVSQSDASCDGWGTDAGDGAPEATSCAFQPAVAQRSAAGPLLASLALLLGRRRLSSQARA